MIKTPSKSMTILIVDDDEEDRELTEEALREKHLLNDIRQVRDGEELLDYLYHRDKYHDAASSPRPGLILLDLNMPRLDGREALSTIKSDASLKNIPVVVLTTSKAHEDVYRSYSLGVNSFITKPVTFERLVEVLSVMGTYWFEIVTLPPDTEDQGGVL